MSLGALTVRNYRFGENIRSYFRDPNAKVDSHYTLRGKKYGEVLNVDKVLTESDIEKIVVRTKSKNVDCCLLYLLSLVFVLRL